jgi:hypothetical protein
MESDIFRKIVASAACGALLLALVAVTKLVQWLF